jgi:hypothetical protein
MKGFDFGRFALSMGAAAAMLAACGGSQPPIGAPGAVPQSRAIATHAERGRSWMRGTNDDLLYATSEHGGLFYYSYPKIELLGEITVNASAAGLCSDPSGDVFFPTSVFGSYTGVIYEYAHGGTQPIAMLSDPGVPNGCAVDPVTGNLAVANVQDSSSSNPYVPNGDVAIYSGAKGTPTMYYSQSVPAFEFCGYDSSGNLYLSSYDANDKQGVLVRLASGSSNFRVINVNKRIAFGTPPSVQWDGQYMTISSLENEKSPAYIYRLSISGSSATVIGTVKLSDAREHQAGQIVINGKSVIAMAGPGHRNFYSWKYPDGGMSGKRTKTIILAPWGLAISHGSLR